MSEENNEAINEQRSEQDDNGIIFKLGELAGGRNDAGNDLQTTLDAELGQGCQQALI